MSLSKENAKKRIHTLCCDICLDGKKKKVPQIWGKMVYIYIYKYRTWLSIHI